MPSGYEVLQPGALFHERYRIVHCIKAGGMGTVYEVVDERTAAPPREGAPRGGADAPRT